MYLETLKSPGEVVLFLNHITVITCIAPCYDYQRSTIGTMCNIIEVKCVLLPWMISCTKYLVLLFSKSYYNIEHIPSCVCGATKEGYDGTNTPYNLFIK